MNQKPKIFWKAYTVLCIMLVILIISVTAFLYDYIKEFESSQTVGVIEKYIRDLSPEVIAELSEDKLSAVMSGFEAEGTGFLPIKEFKNGDISYIEKNDGGILSYDLYLDEKFMTVFMSEVSGGKYGFKKYEVTNGEIFDEWLISGASFVTAIIPETAKLTVNGKAVGASYITADGLPDGNVSEFERGDEYQTSLAMYEIENVFGEVKVEVIFDGRTFTPDASEDGIYRASQAIAEGVFAVTAPFGSEVKINGVPVSEKYKTGVAAAADCNEFEGSDAGKCDIYEISGLRFTPKVEVVYNGEILHCETLDGAAVSMYPETAKSSYTVKIPKGETLLCNGISVSDKYIKADGEGKYSVPDSVSKLTKPSEKYVTYEIGGFYAIPEFSLFSDSVCENDGNSYTFYKAPDAADTAKIRSTAEEFTKRYIKYTYEGTDYTKANLAAVMELVKPDTDAYDIIEVSYESMRFNSNFKVDKLEMKIYGFIEFADGCYGVKVDFDSHGKYARFEKTAVGTFYCVWISEGDDLKLCEFVFI